MKFTGQYTLLALMAGAAVVLSAGEASAQNVTVDAVVEVQNTLTLTVVDDLNFGKIAAISDAAKTASLALNSDTGAATITTTGAPATIATIDATNRKVGQITIEDGANGATINITIGAVANPTNGVVTFTLSDFSTSFNGGADTAQVVATPFAETFTSAFNGGANTLDIGAKITTNVAGTPYPDATYTGSFNVTVTY
jgi:hypothetical protein